jgi:hypothetical protein
LFVACIFLTIALFFWIINYGMTRYSRMNYKAWDVTNVTAGDFTAECTISPEMWD